MKAVNIRQLKSNPSTALAAARADDMVVVMNRDHPQAVLAGFAARMAGKPLAEMLTLFSSQGIPLTGNDKAAADEARADMQTARNWLVKPAV